MDRLREPTGLRLDCYLLVQSAVYHADGLWGEATFDVTFRPDGPWGWLVVAGVREAVEAALDLGFSSEDIAWLRGQPAFRRVAEPFWNWLAELTFSGDILAMPEGTVALPGEPVMRVTGPLPEVCLLETRVVQALAPASGVATRVARLCHRAGGRPVYDFGSRRMATAEASASAARAAWIGGAAGTTDALAASRWGLPVMATMADTLLAAYGDNDAAFRAFQHYFPDLGYVTLPRGDPVGAVEALVPYRRQVRIVRLDSDDLERSARAVRAALDRHGLRHVRILGSGSLDEERIGRLVASGSPVDLLAVGTAIAEGSRVASLRWRLAELARGTAPEPVRHPAAAALPGRKQVVRFDDRDVVALQAEAAFLVEQGGMPLLVPWVEAGCPVFEPEPVNAARRRRAMHLAALPEPVRRGEQRPVVELGAGLGLP